MPKILRPPLYNAVYKAASDYIKTETEELTERTLIIKAEEPLYRYVGYRDFRGQIGSAGRTIWTGLSNDLNNRWTGSDLAGGGKQGLYLSREEIGNSDTKFPEIEHYQNRQVPPNQEIAYYVFEKGKSPIWTKASASELRTMFLFTTEKQLRGLDLRLNGAPNAPDDGMLDTILGLAKKENPNAVSQSETARDLYLSSDDASFARALGNAALDAGFEYFQTSSVRDVSSINVVIGGKANTAFDFLKEQGRATFLIEKGKLPKAVTTIDDMLYNDRVDAPSDSVVRGADSVAPDLKPYKDAATEIGKSIDWSLATSTVDGTIGSEVQSFLQRNPSLYNETTENAMSKLMSEPLGDTLIRRLNAFTTASAAANQRYPELIKNLQADGVISLMADYVTVPKVSVITNSTDTGSYLEKVVRSTYFVERGHFFEQRARVYQMQATTAQSAIATTKTEITSKKQALHDVELQLEDNPTNANLERERASLQTTIEQLVEKQQAEENRAENSMRKQKVDEQERTASEKDQREAEQKREEAAKRIFEEALV